MESARYRKSLLWLAILGSLLASVYAFISSVHYALMSALDTPVPEHTSLWAYVTLGLSVVFFGLFIFLSVCLRGCYAVKP